jgi:hypothetical protein
MTRSRAFFPAALLVLGLGCFHALWLSRGIVYSPNSDIIAHLVGLKAVLQKARAQESGYPLWNPAANCGTPAHAYPNALYDFPTHWLYFFLPIDRATNLSLLAAILGAGLGMYFLAWRLLAERAAAFFCAAGYMLCFRCLNMLQSGWSSVLVLYALTPLLFLTLDRVCARPDRRRTAESALLSCLCLMQGYAQGTYYLSFGALLFVLLRLWGAAWAHRLRVLAALAAGAGLGLLLAAPDFLPRLEFASLSTRLNFSYSFLVHNAPSWPALKTLLDPLQAAGPETWENNFYFGLWLIPGCLFACWKAGRRNLPLLAAAGLLPLLCFDGPLLRLAFFAVPGFKLFRLHSRVLIIEQFILLILAGQGLAILCSQDDPRTRGDFSLACGAAALAGLAAAAAWRNAGPGWAAAGLLLAAVLARTPRLPGRILAAGMCLLPLSDGAWRLLPTTLALEEIFPDLAFYAPLKREAGHGRVAAVGRTAIPYGAAGYLGIDLANGYEPLNLKNFEDYFAVLKYGDPQRVPRAPVVWTDLESLAKPEMLRALDIESIVANERLPLESWGYRLVGAFPDVPVFDFYKGLARRPVFVWRDTRPLGPAYFATTVRPVADPAAALDSVAASASPCQAFVLDLDPPAGGWELSGGLVRMTRRGYGRYSYEVESRGRNFLILSQIWYPGWRAWLDGKEIRLYRTNSALLGCAVPAGRHALRLEMHSPRLELGLGLAAAAAVVVALLLMVPAGRGAAG